jgi:hypothetical protein
LHPTNSHWIDGSLLGVDESVLAEFSGDAERFEDEESVSSVLCWKSRVPSSRLRSCNTGSLIKPWQRVARPCKFRGESSCVVERDGDRRSKMKRGESSTNFG